MKSINKNKWENKILISQRIFQFQHRKLIKQDFKYYLIKYIWGLYTGFFHSIKIINNDKWENKVLISHSIDKI